MALITASPMWPIAKGSAKKTVAAAGTSEALAADTPASLIQIKALAANTNPVYVKLDGVAGTDYKTTQDGYQLSAGQATDPIPLKRNLNEVILDVTTSGEGVCYWYVTCEARG